LPADNAFAELKSAESLGSFSRFCFAVLRRLDSWQAVIMGVD